METNYLKNPLSSSQTVREEGLKRSQGPFTAQYQTAPMKNSGFMREEVLKKSGSPPLIIVKTPSETPLVRTSYGEDRYYYDKPVELDVYRAGPTMGSIGETRRFEGGQEFNEYRSTSKY